MLKIKQILVMPKMFIDDVVNKPELLENIGLVINVSDEPCQSFNPIWNRLNIPSIWVPINEAGDWGYSPFYAAAKAIESVKDTNKKVVIHCHAAVNRSRCIAYAVLIGLGKTESKVEEYLNVKKWFERNIKHQHIPSNIIEFMKYTFEHPEQHLMGILVKIDPENKTRWISDEVPIETVIKKLKKNDCIETVK